MILEDITSVLLEDYFTYITDIDLVTSINLYINLSQDKKKYQQHQKIRQNLYQKLKYG